MEVRWLTFSDHCVCDCSFAYNGDTDEYLAGTATGVEVWKLTQVHTL